MMTWFHWALLSAFFAGLTAILAKVGVMGVDSNLAMAIRTTVVLILAWILVGWTRSQAIFSLSHRTLIFLVLSGLATGLSWLCYFRALQLGPASKVAPVDKLSVVVAILLAVIFLGERMSRYQIFGTILMVTGAALFTVKPH